MILRLDYILGRRERLLSISSLCLRRIPGEVVGPATEDELPRNSDVSTSTANEGMDREGY